MGNMYIGRLSNYKADLFKRVEEVAVTYTSGYGLRNAIFAVVDAGRSAKHGSESRSEYNPAELPSILQFVETTAQQYEEFQKNKQFPCI